MFIAFEQGTGSTAADRMNDRCPSIVPLGELSGGERIQTAWQRVAYARLHVACGDVLVKQTIMMSIYSARHQIFIQGFTWVVVNIMTGGKGIPGDGVLGWL